MNLRHAEILTATLLVIATLVAITSRRFRIPYTVSLVAAGFVAGLAGFLREIPLGHDLILFVFLPPLVFEAAVNMDLSLLRRLQWPVALLTVAGTLLTAAAVGLATWAIGGIVVSQAILLAVIVSPTDPVSVLAVLKEQRAPAGLRTILEGESIFNDALGIVLFGIALRYAYPGFQGGAPSAGWAVGRFFLQVGVGVAVGLAFAGGAHLLMRTVQDHLIELTISVLLTFGTFLTADRLGGSGIVAVVVAGLVVSNFGADRAMSPGTPQRLAEFWEVIAFLINSALFVLIGIGASPRDLFGPGTLALVGLAFAGLLVGRAVSCYGLLARPLVRSVPLQWRHAIFWGGLRGSIPIALVLSLAPMERSLGGEDLSTVVFGVVLVSLLTQGLTFGWLVDSLHLNPAAPTETTASGRVRPVSPRAGELPR